MFERRQLITVIAGGVVLAILFFVIGFFSRSTGCEKNDNGNGAKSGMTIKELDEVHQSIANLMKTEELKDNMKYTIISNFHI